MSNKIFKAVNWNNPDNEYAKIFWEQNLRQFWIDTEYTPSKDIKVWSTLTPQQRETYRKALGGLTLLDTEQSNVGMPDLLEGVVSLQNKAVMAFMTMMEAIHAKSYSTIFTTVCSKEEIDDTFNWIENNKYLQHKASVVDKYYKNAYRYKDSPIHMYLGLAVSVLLESFLFYSGFFFPLWLSGQGKMVACSDIIKKIVADESIHGVFIGLQAQDFFEKIPKESREGVLDELYEVIDDLFNNEMSYTEELYSEVGLVQEVKDYIMYNGNRALSNLALEHRFPEKKVNQIVQNGLDQSTKTTQHDFFSKKSTNYEVATEITPLSDDDFDISIYL